MKKALLAVIIGSQIATTSCTRVPVVVQGIGGTNGVSHSVGFSDTTVQCAQTSEAIISKLLGSHSVSFAKLMKTSSGATFIVDSEDSDSWIIAVGENRKSHFVREGTLKMVKRNGNVFRLELDKDGEEVWVSDAREVAWGQPGLRGVSPEDNK